MAEIVRTLNDFISYLNFLFEADQTPPSSDDEDYAVWTSLANIAINLWENEEGILWKELFVKLADATDGDKTTELDKYSYDCPSDFKFPASAYVWLGTGTNKTSFKVIKIEEVQLHENDVSNWCYFNLADKTLEFNPNATIPVGQTISYNYYKYAKKLTTGTDKFEMSDPMFAVYFALAELKKEEGDNSAAGIASQKLEAMKTRNEMTTWFQEDSLTNQTGEGFGL